MSARTVVASMSRLSLRSPSLSLKLNNKVCTTTTAATLSSPLKCTSQSNIISDSTRRISRLSAPLALSSLLSMMPLHSQIASARLNSILSVESQSWGLIPQGISMPL